MIRVNLAPPVEKRGPRFGVPRLSFGLVFAVIAVLLVAGLGGYWRYLVVEERRLASDIESGTRDLEALKTLVGQAAKVREHLAELEARLKAIEALTVGQGRPLLLIDAFADTVAGDLWITGLEEKGLALRVTGAAFSSTAVSNFMAALRATRKFKDVDIVVSRRDLEKNPNLVTFEVTCRFES